MSKKKDAKIVKTLNVEDLNTILDKVHGFMQSGDDMYCDEDSVQINIYDNGRLEVSGSFNSQAREEIVI